MIESFYPKHASAPIAALAISATRSTDPLPMPGTTPENAARANVANMEAIANDGTVAYLARKWGWR